MSLSGSFDFVREQPPPSYLFVVMFLVLNYGPTFACPAMPTSARPANQQTPSFFTLLRGRASPLLLRRLGRAWLPSRAR